MVAAEEMAVAAMVVDAKMAVAKETSVVAEMEYHRKRRWSQTVTIIVATMETRTAIFMVTIIPT